MPKTTRPLLSKKTKATTNDPELLVEFVRALARQQARQDHKMAAQK